MQFRISDDTFATEEEAVDLLEAHGCEVVAADVDAKERGLHWHDFPAMIAVIEGRLTVGDPDGATISCDAGSVLIAPRAALHTEQVHAGRMVFGFPEGLPDFSAGINLDPADHPGVG